MVARFIGEFEASGFPSEPTSAIPVDPFDTSFLLWVRVAQTLEGALPEGFSQRAVFAVHSPSIFFLSQGLDLPEERYHPDGRYQFRLWQSPSGQRFELDVEPVQIAPDTPTAAEAPLGPFGGRPLLLGDVVTFVLPKNWRNRDLSLEQLEGLAFAPP